jgi:hypothetical protein
MLIPGQEYLNKHNVKPLDHSQYSPDLPAPELSLFPRLKRVLKRQRLASAEEVTTKATTSLTEIRKNDLQECI